MFFRFYGEIEFEADSSFKMKSGFQSDFPVDNEEIQRADQNIPLNKFGLGAAKWVRLGIYIYDA